MQDVLGRLRLHNIRVYTVLNGHIVNIEVLALAHLFKLDGGRLKQPSWLFRTQVVNDVFALRDLRNGNESLAHIPSGFESHNELTV